MFPTTETIRSHKSRAGSPSNLNPASKEMISHSVELCKTEVCFLHIQHIGTNERLPKTHNVPPEVDFESSRSPANRSLEPVPVCIVLQYFPHSKTVCIHMCDECKISIDSGGCHRLWSIFVIDRASLFTDHRISGLPVHAKYKHFRTI